jgi:hypothetical protein
MTESQAPAIFKRTSEKRAGYVPRVFSGASASPLPFRDSGGLVAAPDVAFCASAESRGAGLVYSQTSDTRSGSRLFLDPVASRLSRMRRSTITAARLITEDAAAGGFRWKAAMVTLTYRPGRTYAPRDVSEFLKRARQWAARRGFDLRYVWVLELTRAGVPHYHVVLWLPKGTSMPKPDKQGWWPHGSTRIEWARNAVGYIAKYASKGGDMKALPPGSRICGSGGLSDDARNVRAWWLSPGWVRHQWTPDDRPRASAGGGWCSLVSGEWLPSPWDVGFEFGRVYIKKRGEL